jgi:hypothetical protein
LQKEVAYQSKIHLTKPNATFQEILTLHKESIGIMEKMARFQVLEITSKVPLVPLALSNTDFHGHKLNFP